MKKLSLFLRAFSLVVASYVTSTSTVLAQNFNDYDPLVIGESSAANELSSPAGIVSRVLTYIIPLAGMILFVMIIWGGFEMLTSAVSSKKDAGRQRVTTAIVGFILLFSSYWMAQIVEAVFGVRILN